MDVVLYLLFSSLLTTREVPIGTQVHIRLTNTVGSFATKAGSPVHAVVIAPVVVDGHIMIPAGSEASGTVKSVKRVGFGVIHETASLGLQFDHLTLTDGESLPLAARVDQVDNARERVSRNGEIRGVRTTSSISYRVSGYLRTLILWYVHAEVAEWLVRSLVLQVPEPEIYYPPGVELTLALTQPLISASSFDPPPSLAHFPPADRAALDDLAAALPDRTSAASSNRPSDLINVLFVGTRAQLTAAFEAAGWVQAHPVTLRSGIRGIRAVIEKCGYRSAPMSALRLNEVEADMSWEKGFNDVAKRHHIRIWKQSQIWNGREVWAGAATHDVDFAYLRPGEALTHRIAPDVDDERAKVVNDLDFTSCVEFSDLLARPAVPQLVWNATGDPMRTDGRLAVVGLNDCRTPRLFTQTAAMEPPPPMHGNGLQRFARREVLSFRCDLLRGNIYWRTYEGVRWAVTTLRHHRQRARRNARWSQEVAAAQAAILGASSEGTAPAH